MTKHYIIPIFIPHLGCNNECVFCNQRKISGTLKPVLKENVETIIDTYLKYYDKQEEKEIEVAFFGGSFTGIEEEKQTMYLETVQKYIENGSINSIRLSTRPDYINQKILNNLKKHNVKTIELGVQSLDEGVLKSAKRGHTVEDVEKASKLIKENGFVLGHQVMVGLPTSTFDKEIETVKKSIKLGPEIIRIYPVLVIAKTELENMYESGEYTPLSMEEAVKRSAIITEMYEKENIKVIRTGLHVTEDLAAESSYVAGPMHSAFGQMVKSRIMRNEIEKDISKIEEKNIDILASSKNINFVSGVKKENIKYLNSKYNKSIKVHLDNNINKKFVCKVK